MNFKQALWPEATEKRFVLTDYRKAGFSTAESDEISLIHKNLHHGQLRSLGFGVGAFVLSQYSGFFKNRAIARYSVATITGIVTYYCFDFFTRSDRKAANSSLGNTYTNNLYNTNKRTFNRTFYTFNRRFQKEEIEQFLFNEKLNKFGRKNFVHNPYVHPEEKEHRIKHDTFNDGKQYLSNNMKDLINDQNAEKILNGEKIMMKPYKITDHCDHTGGRVKVPTMGKNKLWKYMAN